MSSVHHSPEELEALRVVRDELLEFHKRLDDLEERLEAITGERITTEEAGQS